MNITHAGRRRAPPGTAALVESEDLLRRLFQHAPDAIVVVDQHSRIARANRQAEKIFGYRNKKLIGQTIETLVPERFRQSHGRRRGVEA